MIRVIAVAVAVIAATGCSTHYMPMAHGRVSTIMQGGQMAYVRDGRVIRRGALGGGLIEAVRGNPAAERAARTFYQRNRDGLVMSLSGLACTAFGAGWLAYTLEGNDGQVRNSEMTLPMITTVGCLVLSYAGLFYMASGQPYSLDAINIFNDGPTCTPRLPPGYYGANQATAPSTCPSAEVLRPRAPTLAGPETQQTPH